MLTLMGCKLSKNKPEDSTFDLEVTVKVDMEKMMDADCQLTDAELHEKIGKEFTTLIADTYPKK